MSSSKYGGFCIGYMGINGTGKTFEMLKLINAYKRNVLILMDDDSEEAFDNYTVINQSQIGKFKGRVVAYPPTLNKKDKKSFFNDVYQNFGKKLDSKGNEILKESGTPEFEGGLLLFDDAMTVLSTRDEEVMQIFKKRRQRKLDIMLNFHGFSEYPISLVKNTTHLVIKKTTDSTKGFSDRLNPEVAKKLVEAVNYVNEMATPQNPYFQYIFDLKYPENNKSF